MLGDKTNLWSLASVVSWCIVSSPSARREVVGREKECEVNNDKTRTV